MLHSPTRTLHKFLVWGSTLLRLVIAATLAGLIPGAGITPEPVQAAGVLTITNRTSPYIIIDHNNGLAGPQVFTVETRFCNTGDATLTNVFAYIGTYLGNPGVFPTTTFAGNQYQLQLLDEVLHTGDRADATRYLGDIPATNPDTCISVFWPLVYPRSASSLEGLVLQYDIWGVSDQSSASVTNPQVELRRTLTASENQVTPNPGGFSTVVPNTAIQIGQQVKICYDNSTQGTVGHGLNGVNDFWIQPNGGIGWDPSSLRMVSVEASFTNGYRPNQCTPGNGTQPYVYEDRTYFNQIDSGDWDGDAATGTNGLEACKANSQSIEGDYCYTFVAIGPYQGSPNFTQNTFTAYQQASSGGQQKYNGDFGETVPITVNPQCSILLDKEADKANVSTPGETITYNVEVVSLLNNQSIGFFPGAPVVITETLPYTWTTITADPVTCTGDASCSVFYTTLNPPSGAQFPANFTAAPGNVVPSNATQLHIVLENSLQGPSNSVVENITYKVTVPTLGQTIVAPRSISYFANGPICSTSGTVSTTPVTLAHFKATEDGDRIRFEWSTATETANAGFDLYAETALGLVRLNDDIIPSAVIDSLEPQNYSFEAAGVTAQVFYIDDMDVSGASRRHGPFQLGETYGEPAVVERLDWPTIRAEHAAKEQHQRAADVAAVNAQIASLAVAAASSDVAADPIYEQYAFLETGEALPLSLFVPMVPTGGGKTGSAAGKPQRISTAPTVAAGRVNLGVSQTGLYRVTYEDLLAAGFDYNGVTASDLALTNRGQPVVIRLMSGKRFGPGAYFEFYGEALDTLYTTTNIYTLELNASLAARTGLSNAGPAKDAQVPNAYTEVARFDNDRAYTESSPGDEPWYDIMLFASSGAVSGNVVFNVDGYVPSAGPARLELGMWGGSNWGTNNDHHLLVRLNGQQIADAYFDGINTETIAIDLPAGLLINGQNTLTLVAPKDHGVRWDIMYLDRYTVTYPRTPMVRNNSLSFTAAGEALRVDGLTSSDVVVYRSDSSGLVRLGNVVVEPANGGYAAKFVGSGQPATYYVAATGALLKPSFSPAPAPASLTGTPANFLIISHPSFIADLNPLVAQRTAQGYIVRIVDVNDVYAQYSHGIFDPVAIQKFIADASKLMGTKYVLLVGGDTYDYRNRLGKNSLSFIPSLYGATDDRSRFAPLDALYVDADTNGVPDLAIGRFPVRTSAELQTAIAKTLTYGAATDYTRKAVFAADANDANYSFAAFSDGFINSLGAGWEVQRAYLSVSGVSTARTALLNAINAGAGLVSYVGHSSPTRWTTTGLFSATDAAGLTNAGKPTVVVQWGCWNAYYASPDMNTLGHKFMLSGDRGAAAVLGAAALATASSEAKLGPLVMARLAQPGVTLGDAVLQAKQELAQTEPHLADVLLGWTILGDPTIVVTK